MVNDTGLKFSFPFYFSLFSLSLYYSLATGGPSFSQLPYAQEGIYLFNQ